MNPRRTCALLVVVLAAGAGVATAERLPIRTFTTADGLPHNAVRRIVRDSRGFLWFCTAEGLARFDGYGFTTFGTPQGLPHTGVNDLLETRAGDYWVATDGGLVRFNPTARAGPMFSVLVPDDPDRRARVVTVLREDRSGTLWLGTDKGLLRLVNDEGGPALRPVEIGMPRDYPEQREVTDLLEDRQGTLWIGTAAGLYRRSPGGRSARYAVNHGLPNDYVARLVQDADEHLWVATLQGGFFRLRVDDTTGTPAVDEWHSEPELPTPWVFGVFEASDGRFWVATARGLLEFVRGGDDGGHRIRRYGTNNGLTDYEITTITEDLAGNLWLGTSSSGAMKVAARGFRSYGERDGLRHVSAIFEDRAGTLCLRGSVLGDLRTSVFEGASLELVNGAEPEFHPRIGCFDGRTFDWFVPAGVVDPGWVNERVTLQTSRGEWWLGTGEGVLRYPASDRMSALETTRPIAIYTTSNGLAAQQVYRLFEDSRGNVWVSTTSPWINGLSLWEPSTGLMRDIAATPGFDRLRDDWPARAFAEDLAGHVWAGFENELVRFRHGRAEVFGAAHGLPRGKIRDLYVDGTGRLWLAMSQSGLVLVPDPVTDRPAFVSRAEGLASLDLEVVVADQSGRLYLGGGHGLARFDPATGRVKHYGASEGLAAGTFRAAFRDRRGEFWFGTSAGLAHLAPDVETPASPPLVLITGARAGSVPAAVSALGERDLLLPDLAPDARQVQIEYVALGFGAGDILRYQHQLEGGDGTWSRPSEERTVTFASLAPGRYRFAVRALNSDGTVSADPAVVRFTVLAPVWQRSWFVVLALAVAVAVAGALHRVRVARLLDVANMRMRIATDLHDDIGANLTRIALLSEVARRTRDDGPLVSVARIARESVATMSDIVWAINPNRETLRDLIRRMRQHADEIFTLRGVALQFDAPEASESVSLGMDVRRDLLLIFKEAVSNAARHSQCTAISIRICVEPPQLVLTVDDNGAGFDATMGSDGHGLRSMQQRAERLGGRLVVTSRPGAGTTVCVRVPF